MSTRLEGGGRKDEEAFLSAHRCPEVDLLPHHKSETRILPPASVSADSKQPEVSSTGQPDSNYLDVSSTPHCDEDEDGTISDWSEEDLSLHFSPSVIISSDDEESEGTFECVDVTMETLVNGQEGEGPKMVPKRQIQLKKKEEENTVKEKKFQGRYQTVLLSKPVSLYPSVCLPAQVKNEPAEGKDGSSEVLAHETLSPRMRQRPDLLLRQHSMPASTTSGEADGYRVYRGLIAGANQGLHVGGNTKQRLQKSFSLDETKTKMASCIIKSVLSKKMQAEQSHCKTSHVQNKPTVVPNLPQAVEQQRAREGGGGGGETGGGVPKAPIHVVRDMRSLVKNTYSHTFATSQNSKPLRFKVVSQRGSPPPSYQQAVGVKVHNQSKNSVGGTVKPVSASLMQPQQRNQRNRANHLITQQRRGSEPTINRRKQDEVIRPGAPGLAHAHNPSKSSGPEKAGAVSPKAAASLPPSEVTQPPLCPPSSRHPETTQPLGSGPEQSAILGVPSQFGPGNPQQIFHPCFYTPAALPPFAPTVVRHMGKVSYVQAPLNYIPAQLQPNLHLLRTPEENQSGLTGSHPNPQVCSPLRLTTGAQKSNSATATPATREQPEQQAEEQRHEPQQPLLPAVRGFLPAEGRKDALQDTASSAASTSGALSNVPAPSHGLDPPNLQCFYVDVATQSQRKMLLDPETGQYVQVFLPAASTTCSSSSVFPVGLANPAPFASTAMKPAPAMLSLMQFQPAIAVSPLYAPPFLPFPLHAPSIHFTHTPL